MKFLLSVLVASAASFTIVQYSNSPVEDVPQVIINPPVRHYAPINTQGIVCPALSTPQLTGPDMTEDVHCKSCRAGIYSQLSESVKERFCTACNAPENI